MLGLSIDLRPVRIQSSNEEKGIWFSFWPENASKHLDFVVEARAASATTWQPISIKAPDLLFADKAGVKTAVRARELWWRIFTNDLVPLCAHETEISAFDTAARIWNKPDADSPGAMEARFATGTASYSYSAIRAQVQSEILEETGFALAAAIARAFPEARAGMMKTMRDQTKRARLEQEIELPFDPVPPISRWRSRAKDTFPQLIEPREPSSFELALRTLRKARRSIAETARAFERPGRPDDDLRSAMEKLLQHPDARLSRTERAERAANVLSALDAHYAPDRADANAEEVQGPLGCREDQIRRRIAALQAHPTCRKFLRLIADVKIDPHDLVKAAGTAGFIRVRAKGTRQPDKFEDPPETAFDLRIRDGKAIMFEPRPRLAVGVTGLAALPLDRGVVRLNEKGKVSDQRFVVETVDAVAAVQAFRSAAASTVEAHDNGVPVQDIPVGLPGLQTRGVMILDRDVHEAARAEAELDAKARVAPRLVYAEDLINGLRPAVVHPTTGELFSTVGRRVVYPDIWEAFDIRLPTRPDVNIRHPYEEFADRDDGIVMPTSRVIQEKDGSGKDVTRISESEVLLTWNGEAMAVPTIHDEDNKENRVTAVEKEDLPVSSWIGPRPEMKLPSLRRGGKYLFMLLACKPNGSSIPLDVAKELVAPHALGAGRPGQEGKPAPPFIYSVGERSQAPDILVPETDRLVGSKPATTPNEADRILVIRDDEEGPAEVVRVLLAPAISDLAAEQARLMDGPEQLKKRKGVYRYVRRSPQGAYPEIGRAPSGGPGFQGSAGHLFQATGSGNAPPFFVDPLTKHLGAGFRRGKSRPAFYRHDALDLKFWDSDSPTNESVKPIILRLKTCTQSGINGRLVKGKPTLQTPAGLDADELVVEIGPGEDVLLDLWCHGPGAHWFRDHAVGRPALAAAVRVLASPELRKATMRRSERVLTAEIAAKLVDSISRGDLSDPALAEVLHVVASDLEDLFSREAVDTLMTKATLRLVHAVRQPRRPPAFRGSRFAFVRIKEKDESGWPTHVAILEDAAKPPCSDGYGKIACSQPGGSAAYAIGNVEFDRKSTDELRIESVWMQHGGPEAVELVQGPDGPFWKPRPVRREIRPLVLSGISRRDDAAAADILSLTRDDDGLVRRAKVLVDSPDPSADTIARRVAARIVGASRFREFFRSDGNPPPRPESFEKASATRDALWQALDPESPDQPAGIALFWMLATARPPRPEIVAEAAIRTLEPVLKSDVVTAEYRVRRRLWLGRNWYASGEGEKLAIICARDARASAGTTLDQGSIEDLVEAKQLPGWAAPFVTQWAGDPTLKTHLFKADTPPAEAIKGAEKPIPLLLGPADAGDAAPVTAYPMTPKLHPQRGEWYVDIDIDPQLHYSAMLRLGIARYQPNALPGLELSLPMALEPFALPSRWDIRIRREGDSVSVKVMGAGYEARAPAVLGLAGADHPDFLARLKERAHEPVIQFELADAATGLPVVREGETVFKVLLKPNDTQAGRKVWAASLPLPDRVLVTEVMTHANSRFAVNPADFEAVVTLPSGFAADLPIPVK
jgi:hypothetical protein